MWEVNGRGDRVRHGRGAGGVRAEVEVAEGGVQDHPVMAGENTGKDFSATLTRFQFVLSCYTFDFSAVSSPRQPSGGTGNRTRPITISAH